MREDYNKMQKSLKGATIFTPAFVAWNNCSSPTPSTIHVFSLNFKLCYETIMFGQVTHTLDAVAMWVRSFV